MGISKKLEFKALYIILSQAFNDFRPSHSYLLFYSNYANDN